MYRRGNRTPVGWLVGAVLAIAAIGALVAWSPEAATPITVMLTAAGWQPPQRGDLDGDRGLC